MLEDNLSPVYLPVRSVVATPLPTSPMSTKPAKMKETAEPGSGKIAPDVGSCWAFPGGVTAPSSLPALPGALSVTRLGSWAEVSVTGAGAWVTESDVKATGSPVDTLGRTGKGAACRAGVSLAYSLA